MKKTDLLFLDFDGVLCDSLPETLVSSWIAYHSFIRHDQPDAMPADFMKHFSLLRPFIRSGEDYLLLQDLITRNLTIGSQPEFDRHLSEAGQEQMARYKEIFYRARQDLLERDPEFWFSLNPVFPPLRRALTRNSPNGRIFILSTKRREFIMKILEANTIDFLTANVIDSGNENKAGIISGLLDQAKAAKAHFIDDQLSHLQGVPDERIELYLAAWGYVKPEWVLQNQKIRVLTLEKAAHFVANF
jgi:phosphoglycolate phosphatase-like HAD superfamily hydrolase